MRRIDRLRTGGIKDDEDDRDVDLERILRLYELVKRYEFLVEHLIDQTWTKDVGVLDAQQLQVKWRQKVARHALDLSDDHLERAAQLLGIDSHTLRLWEQGKHMRDKRFKRL